MMTLSEQYKAARAEFIVDQPNTDKIKAMIDKFEASGGDMEDVSRLRSRLDVLVNAAKPAKKPAKKPASMAKSKG